MLYLVKLNSTYNLTSFAEKSHNLLLKVIPIATKLYTVRKLYFYYLKTSVNCVILRVKEAVTNSVYLLGEKTKIQWTQNIGKKKFKSLGHL